jgi:hypothetical protein
MNRTLENRRQHKTAYLAQMNVRMPSNMTWKTDVKRGMSLRRRQKTPYLAQVIQGMPLGKKLENRRRAPQRHSKTSLFVQMEQGTPMDTE